MGKALFFDIDGTLVNFQGQMPDSAKRALRKAQENGHLLVICSGRSACQIYPSLREMGFDGIIAAAGAYVECHGQVIYRHHMDVKTADRVCGLLEETHAYYSAHTEDKILLTAECKRRTMEKHRELKKSKEFSERLESVMEVVESVYGRANLEKFTFHDSQFVVSQIRERLADCCDVTDLSFHLSTEKDGEISAKGINKALGIRKFIEHAGIAWEDTVAFGDGANDIDMLEYAYTGVAMGNAPEGIKKYADFVTRDIEEDGIAYALAELGLT